MKTIAASLWKAHLLTTVLLVMALGSWATHLVGGELTYENLGGNTYRVTLTVYRDCGPANTTGAGFDDPSYVGVFSGTTLQQVINFPLSEAQVSNVPIFLENPCFIPPVNLCIQKAVYTKVVTLVPGTNGLNLVYQRCCRNNSILNLVAPNNTGMSLHAYIPGGALVTTPNSSAVFDNPPPVALCLNGAFFYDHGATDPDGDQLVYSFCTPKHGGGPDNNAPPTDPNSPAPNPPLPPPFNNVQWLPGYSSDYQLDANPAFNIDPATGYITGTPTQLGRFATGVCVSEFRNGVLLNTTLRDFQYDVSLCDPNIVASIPNQTSFCDGLTVNFGNNSINSQSYFWDFGDPLNPNSTSTQVTPSYTYTQPGTYQIMLVANPGWPCADTAYTNYNILAPLMPTAEYVSFSCATGVPVYSFQVGGQFSVGSTFQWTLPPGWQMLSQNQTNMQATYAGSPGNFSIQMTATFNGCQTTATVNVNIPAQPVAIIEDQDTFCDGFTYQFGNLSQNAETYSWQFDVPGASSTEFEPTFTFPEIGVYWVSLTASNSMTCPSTTGQEFDIYTLLNPSFAQQAVQCFNGHSFDFTALGTEASNPVFAWDFGPLASIQTSSTQTVNNVTFSEPGVFPVTITISENGCVRDFTGYVTLLANPVAGYYFEPGAGCPPLQVQFVDTSIYATPPLYTWTFGDGTTSSAYNPVHFYYNSGQYNTTLTITTTSGCIDQVTASAPAPVWVYPVPQAGFTINPDTVNLFEPTVQVIDQSIGSVSCSYDFGEGGTSDNCDLYYDFADGGRFLVSQVVSNEFGCKDSTLAQVVVLGFVFYAPNAFTPNGDGPNNFYLPVALGIKSYELSIYDRWGEKIFYSQDRSEPWDGTFKGQPVQDGLYLYRALVRDNFYYPHEYSGHIILLR